jgi:hypothetical protein
VGTREGGAFRLVDGLLTWVEAGGVLGAPGFDDHVVAGCLQAVRQLGGMPGTAALVRVGRADDRNMH